jgi:putative membrane protein
MRTVASVVIVFVALLHLYFLVLEMFFWDMPLGRRIFRLTPEFATASRALAANQGLYNGFLAIGLLYALFLGDAGRSFQVLFLVFVTVAGVFGAFTVNKRIFWIQAVPAIVAIGLLMLS